MNAFAFSKVSVVTLILAASPLFLMAAGLPDVTDTNQVVLEVPVSGGVEVWKDPAQPVAARVADLVSRMTLPEKVSQMRADAPAVRRLGLPICSYRNECLHGVAGTNVATVFPQAIAMAATWDTPLIHEEADVIATEARAKHNAYADAHNGDAPIHYGLSFYTPNINIVRDPRWGRGQETYGEDPFLTGQFGVAFIRGLQGDDPRYIKIMACAKHYVVHSGPEPERHRLDVNPPERDFYETYLPAFDAAVHEGHVGSIMGAYSSFHGLPDCANPFLLTDLLRKQWGFDGFIVSDGGAISDIWRSHKYVRTAEEAAAVAVKAGCNLCSPGAQYDVLVRAVHDGLISEKEIDTALSYDLTARFKLGLFDPPAMVPWSNIGLADNATPEHDALALKVAEESMVLLKNNGLLPLKREKIKRIAVIGPNADSQDALLGSLNYHGIPLHPVTILAGLRAIAGAGIDVVYEPGCPLALRDDRANQPTPDATARVMAAAKSADVVIYVGGLDGSLESEENARPKVTYDGFKQGDRTRIELPSVQENLLRQLAATGKPVVFVNCSGSAIAMPWAARHLPAILQAWYPGEAGGTAVAETLFGEANPAGRLPITFYRSTDDLPSFEDYSMSNRTYRYFNGKPLFAFGYGLSYTKFSYSGAKLEAATLPPDGTIKLAFTLKNKGKRDGDEVAEVYFRHVKSTVPQPKEALCGFARVHLTRGESTTVTLDIPANRLRYWDVAGKQYVVEPGKYELLIGAASDDIRLRVPLVIAANP